MRAEPVKLVVWVLQLFKDPIAFLCMCLFLILLVLAREIVDGYILFEDVLAWLGR